MNQTNQELRDYLTALEKIKRDGPAAVERGICWNVSYECEKLEFEPVLYEITARLSKGWVHHSGRRDLPVPDRNGLSYNASNLWDRKTEYGRLRWDLLDYLIARTKTELGEEK